MHNFSEIGSSELEYGEGASEEEEADKIAFRDDTDAVQTVHDISSVNSIGEEMAVLSTPDYTEAATGNHSLLANGENKHYYLSPLSDKFVA